MSAARLIERARVEPEHARRLNFQHPDFREVRFDALAMMQALHAAFAPGRTLTPVDGAWLDEDDNGIAIEEREFLRLPEMTLSDVHYTLLLDGIRVATMLGKDRVLTDTYVTIVAPDDAIDVVMDLVLDHTGRADLAMVLRRDR